MSYSVEMIATRQFVAAVWVTDGANRCEKLSGVLLSSFGRTSEPAESTQFITFSKNFPSELRFPTRMMVYVMPFWFDEAMACDEFLG
ncbi:hypothetical protein IV203_004528 [Nitzschia inconspicua]|uniref:Uncharacterized protein n=1 Tax=Nitzschia inconspicua TaxID=303405 RepID=A0A9K3L478_9STRA|nr:hypothetical protein IV203_004528 [Nitzschia inconspicua]